MGRGSEALAAGTTPPRGVEPPTSPVEGELAEARCFATVAVCRVAAPSGGARHDLASCTAGEDSAGVGVGNGVVTLTGSASWFVVVRSRLVDIFLRLAGLRSRAVVSGCVVGVGRRTGVVDVVRRELAANSMVVSFGYVDVELLFRLGHVAGPCR